MLVPALFILTLHFPLATSRNAKIGSGRFESHLNPDIAMGRQFHVNAKQWDGTMRCFFIIVGSHVEQGPANRRDNKDCKGSYRKEIFLGRYERTMIPESNSGGDSPAFRQEYSHGDSIFCDANVKRKDRKGIVNADPEHSRPTAHNVRRKTTLIMLKVEDQVGITAEVREPRKCVYEVTLRGPEILLLGDPSATGSPRISAAAGVSQSQKKAKNPSESRPKNAENAKRSDAFEKAANVVADSSREALLAKPLKELNRLLRDLGAYCKACSEKAHIVDKLQQVTRSEL